MAAFRLCVLLVWATITAATAQSRISPDKPSDTLDKEFHRQRREQLRKQLPARSVAVFFAAPVRNRSNDVDYYYHQDPDFYYLTGYNEPNAVLIVYAEPQTIDGKQVQDLLFVQPNDPRAEQWNGKRLGVEGASSALGIATQPNTAFKPYLDKAKLQQVYAKPLPADVRDDKRDNADLYSLLEQFKAKNLTTDVKALELVMGQMREQKTPEEINLLRKAVSISAMGQVEVMKAMKPGMSELEIQGLHEFVHNKYGAHFVGYPSIVGAGNNGCVLHYIESAKPTIGSNELVLMDVGAEYKGYTADVTRTIPANGKFSPEQKIIYELVLKAQDAGIEQCKVGNQFSAPTQAAQEVIAEGLIKLGIIKNKTEVRRYFPHGATHYIGLDVHDAGTYGPFKPNSVVTVEPGIYIPEGSPCDKKWWGIGIRIEDDILIAEKGWENLSKQAPRTVAEIEKMMAQPSALDDFVLPEIK
jgi:Xaa-Pro aminopeptidase